MPGRPRRGGRAARASVGEHPVPAFGELRSLSAPARVDLVAQSFGVSARTGRSPRRDDVPHAGRLDGVRGHLRAYSWMGGAKGGAHAAVGWTGELMNMAVIVSAARRTRAHRQVVVDDRVRQAGGFGGAGREPRGSSRPCVPPPAVRPTGWRAPARGSSSVGQATAEPASRTLTQDVRTSNKNIALWLADVAAAWLSAGMPAVRSRGRRLSDRPAVRRPPARGGTRSPGCRAEGCPPPRDPRSARSAGAHLLGRAWALPRDRGAARRHGRLAFSRSHGAGRVAPVP